MGGQGADTFQVEPVGDGFAGDEVLFFDPSQGDKYLPFIMLW
jgi:hypothetical protein